VFCIVVQIVGASIHGERDLHCVRQRLRGSGQFDHVGASRCARRLMRRRRTGVVTAATGHGKCGKEQDGKSREPPCQRANASSVPEKAQDSDTQEPDVPGRGKWDGELGYQEPGCGASSGCDGHGGVGVCGAVQGYGGRRDSAGGGSRRAGASPCDVAVKPAAGRKCDGEVCSLTSGDGFGGGAGRGGEVGRGVGWVDRLEGLDDVETTVAHASAEGLRVSDGLRCIGLRAARLQFVEERRCASDEWRAEGSAGAGSVGAERIGGDDLFAGSSDPDDGVAEIRERRTLIEKVGGRNAHDVGCVRGGIDSFLEAVVARGGDANDVQLICVREGIGKFLGIGFRIETHVDDVGAMLRGVVDGAKNVGEVGGTIGAERFEREQVCLGGDEMNYAHDHGAMSECGVLRVAVEDGGSGLIENGGGRLIDLRGSGRISGGRRLGEVRHLGAIGLIAGEIVSSKENGLQSGMIRINAGVDVRDDANAGNLEGTLRFGDADFLSGGLVGVAVPNGCTEVSDGSGVGESSRDGGKCVYAADERKYLVELHVKNARGSIERVDQQSWINRDRSSDEEDLVKSAVDCAHHGATLEYADGGEQLLAEVGPHDEAIIGGGRLRGQQRQAEQQEYDTVFHERGHMKSSFSPRIVEVQSGD